MMNFFGFDLAGRSEPGLWRGMVFGLLAALCEAIPYVVLVVAFGATLGGQGVTTSLILAITAALVAAFLGAWLFRARALFDSFVATYGLVADMRLATADRLGRMSLGRVMRWRGAGLADLFTDRFSLYQDIVTHMWWQVTAAAGFPTLLWLVLMAVDWRIGLAVAGFAPIAAIAVPWSFRLLDRATDAVIPVRNDTANRIVEIAEGIKDLAVLDPARSRLTQAEGAVAELERKSLATELAPAPAIMVFGFVWSIALAAATLLAALLWSHALISGFALIASLALTARLTAALADLGIFLVEYRFARRALGSIRAFADQPLQDVSSSPRLPADASVEIDAVSFAHEDELTLSDISLSIPSGSMLALVGPSGSGKSTLASLVARLWDVDRGTIRIGGVNVRDMTPETLNATVSMVLQDVSLFELTVTENIRLGRPDASLAEVEAAARAARIHERILVMPQGYDTELTGGGVELSGGERQRLAIARAILKDAPVLILDEATASIDLDNERAIQEALETLTAGRTVIIIAHRLWTITEGDQIAVLEKGRLAQRGRHAELLEQDGIYQKLWRDQVRSKGWTIRA